MVAVEHLKRTGRNLRISVDVPIWLFQVRSDQEEETLLSVPSTTTYSEQNGQSQPTMLDVFATNHRERLDRPLRIAIDTPIGEFQVQSAQGGKNPALRSLYYRLLRLLSLPTKPLFVFDGRHKTTDAECWGWISIGKSWLWKIPDPEQFQA